MSILGFMLSMGEQRTLSSYSSVEEWDKVAMAKAYEKWEASVGGHVCPQRCICVVLWVCGSRETERVAGQRKCSQEHAS